MAAFLPLSVFPPTIEFVGPSYEKPQTIVFGLFNKNKKDRIAFKVQANCRNIIDVSQVFGYVEPLGTTALTITCKPMTDDDRKRRTGKHLTIMSCHARLSSDITAQEYWADRLKQHGKITSMKTHIVKVHFYKEGAGPDIPLGKSVTIAAAKKRADQKTNVKIERAPELPKGHAGLPAGMVMPSQDYWNRVPPEDVDNNGTEGDAAGNEGAEKDDGNDGADGPDDKGADSTSGFGNPVAATDATTGSIVSHTKSQNTTTSCAAASSGFSTLDDSVVSVAKDKDSKNDQKKTVGKGPKSGTTTTDVATGGKSVVVKETGPAKNEAAAGGKSVVAKETGPAKKEAAAGGKSVVAKETGPAKKEAVEKAGIAAGKVEPAKGAGKKEGGDKAAGAGKAEPAKGAGQKEGGNKGQQPIDGAGAQSTYMGVGPPKAGGAKGGSQPGVGGPPGAASTYMGVGPQVAPKGAKGQTQGVKAEEGAQGGQQASAGAASTYMGVGTKAPVGAASTYMGVGNGGAPNGGSQPAGASGAGAPSAYMGVAATATGQGGAGAQSTYMAAVPAATAKKTEKPADNKRTKAKK